MTIRWRNATLLKHRHYSIRHWRKARTKLIHVWSSIGITYDVLSSRRRETRYGYPIHPRTPETHVDYIIMRRRRKRMSRRGRCDNNNPAKRWVRGPCCWAMWLLEGTGTCFEFQNAQHERDAHGIPVVAVFICYSGGAITIRKTWSLSYWSAWKSPCLYFITEILRLNPSIFFSIF